MDKLNQLKDLLKHQIEDLQSAEQQIIEALPAMIDKAKDRQLKKALQDHLDVTHVQRERLDEIMLQLDEEPAKKAFLPGLFGSKKCKGIEGLIKEGEKTMSEEMDPDVMDAAIIGSAQKIEHYEISGYGTARAYAEELRLPGIAKQLTMTLDEEYEADDLLTELAVGRLNKEAVSQRRTSSRRTSTRNQSSRKTQSGSKSVRTSASKAAPAKARGRSPRKKSTTK
jgi:ferritin-like metal-binding protein YciE